MVNIVVVIPAVGIFRSDPFRGCRIVEGSCWLPKSFSLQLIGFWPSAIRKNVYSLYSPLIMRVLVQANIFDINSTNGTP